MESRYGEVAVASTSGNEHQRSQLTGNSKVRRRSTRYIEHTRLKKTAWRLLAAAEILP